MFSQNARVLLPLIIFLGFLLRVTWLNQYPVGFTGDEAQQGYDAYSILLTGRDEWGEFLPLFPRGFGDYKAPLYTYLAIPAVALFDLNEFAVRFPSVVIGVLTILTVYFLATTLFNRQVGIWSAFLLAISPWHIQLSRTAYEANSGIFLFSLGLLLYLKSATNRFLLLPAYFIFGLNLYSYHSWRVFTPLFVLILSILIIKKSDFKILSMSLIIFLVFSLPIIFNLPQVMRRSNDISIFSPKSIDGYFKTKATSNLPPQFARLMDNKITYVGGQFTTNYLSYFSPTFLFTGARSDSSYLNFPNTPLHYGLELVFIGYGLFLFVTKYRTRNKILLIWLFLGPIPAAMIDSFGANRAITLLPLTVIISAYGLTEISNYIKARLIKQARYISPAIMSLLIISLSFFIYTYLYQIPKNPPHNLRYGYKEAFNKIISLDNKFDKVIISKHYSMPHIFVAFYKKMDPLIFQAASRDWLKFEQENKTYVDQLGSYRLGKYEFRGMNWNADRENNYLVVSEIQDFPGKVTPIIDIKSPQDKIIFRIVSTKENFDKII